jgi:serine/threonine protein kinase SCH9
MDNDVARSPSGLMREAGMSRSSSRSSGSIVMVKYGTNDARTPPWPPDELPSSSTGQDLPDTEASKLPPTPLSPTSSILQKESESAENGKSLASSGISSVTQALKNLVMSGGPLSHKARRHQSLPVSSVTTDPVLAAHISNPSTNPQSPTQKSSRSPTPASTESPDKLPISKYFRESGRLTSDAAAESRVKTTPPHTPRALSHEGGHPEKKSPLSNASANLSQEWSNDENEKPTNGSKTDGLPVHAPKGKLAVKIDRARKLKPSYDPYVVCVFEWNEYISNGPKHDAMDVDEENGGPKKGRKEQLSSVPIRRTDSDMGKPMSIMMKSRQGSNNSNADGHDQQVATVTNPQWAHEAML